MDAQQAIERLYEDESVSGALEDTAAAPLMKWAEAQLTRLVQSAPDEPRFEQDFAKLRKLIKRIGRYIDRRREWSEAEQADELDVIKGEAQTLSAPLIVGIPADYAKKPAVDIVMAMIGTLGSQVNDGAVGVPVSPHDAPTTEIEAPTHPDADQTETRESPTAHLKGRELDITSEIPATPITPSIESPQPPVDASQPSEKPEEKGNLFSDIIKRIFEE